MNKPHDSLLTFYSAKTGKKLHESRRRSSTTSRASPTRRRPGLLYATDFAWMAAGEGGLFRLDADRQSGAGVKATKIASLDKPTALAFAPDGTLYVTVVGPKKDDENCRQGRQAAEDRRGAVIAFAAVASGQSLPGRSR